MSSQPTRISRYEIKGLIAQGGMGDLYLARDPNTDRLVALIFKFCFPYPFDIFQC